MSKEKCIEWYTQHVPRDAALVERLRRAESVEAFAAISLTEARKAGFDFTRDDIAQLVAEREKSNASDELDDDRLDKVAGGTLAELMII